MANIDWGVVLPAVGIFIGVFLTAIVTYRAARVSELEKSYQKLQKTYEDVNARLNNELEAERLARRADRLSCETKISDQQLQITELSRQVTVLLTQGPEMVRKVVIVGAEIPKDDEGKFVSAVPSVIVGPLPLPMTQAERIAAAKEAKSTDAT